MRSGENSKQRIDRLIKEGKMPQQAVIEAEKFWQTNLRKPLVGPLGVEITVTLGDFYHAIVDPRIWRHPERIKMALKSVVEIVESKNYPSYEVWICRWKEDGKEITAIAVIAPDRTLKTLHIGDEKRIKRLKKGVKILWSK
ncbi:hypothetical protein SDD30_17215 [Moorella naiadis]|uniref:hypothetical protein n=1 Tax=Moorella naiadis (nom. illeg.) TaxID=3093670 RepID=UPI003D9C99F2